MRGILLTCLKHLHNRIILLNWKVLGLNNKISYQFDANGSSKNRVWQIMTVLMTLTEGSENRSFDVKCYLHQSMIGERKVLGL
jgi:hypothetical protein